MTPLPFGERVEYARFFGAWEGEGSCGELPLARLACGESDLPPQGGVFK